MSEENTMVAKVLLHIMRQDRDEPIHAYGARLRGQASVRKFTTPCVNCEADIDYTETILRDVRSSLIDRKKEQDMI